MLHDIPKLLRVLKTGNVQYTVHALEQMHRRKLTEFDVQSIGASCVHTQWQAARNTYLIVGYTADGKGAAFSCKIDEGVVVVTVMRRHLTKKERTGNK